MHGFSRISRPLALLLMMQTLQKRYSSTAVAKSKQTTKSPCVRGLGGGRAAEGEVVGLRGGWQKKVARQRQKCYMSNVYSICILLQNQGHHCSAAVASRCGRHLVHCSAVNVEDSAGCQHICNDSCHHILLLQSHRD